MAERCTSCVVWPPHGELACRAPVHRRAEAFRARAACRCHQLVRSRRGFQGESESSAARFYRGKDSSKFWEVTIVVEQAAKMTSPGSWNHRSFTRTDGSVRPVARLLPPAVPPLVQQLACIHDSGSRAELSGVGALCFVLQACSEKLTADEPRFPRVLGWRKCCTAGAPACSLLHQSTGPSLRICRSRVDGFPRLRRVNPRCLAGAGVGDYC